MLRLCFTLLGLVCAASVMAGKAPGIEKKYNADAIAENVYVIHGPRELPNPDNQGFMNNPSFIVTDKGVVVVDPGSSIQVGEMVLTHIDAITSKPIVAVLNTHIHGDHWLGNQAIVARYPEVIIYAHPEMIAQSKNGQGEFWVHLMAQLTEGATVGTVVVLPTSEVADGDVIQAAGLDIHVIHNGMAHSDTDIMLYLPQLSLIYLGDNAGNDRILRMDHGSFRGNIEALEMAVATGAKLFVPGHGISGDKSVATSYRDFLDTLYSTMQQAYEDELEDYEARPLLLPKLQRWQTWSGFDHELGLLINSAYLEIESEFYE